MDRPEKKQRRAHRARRWCFTIIATQERGFLEEKTYNGWDTTPFNATLESAVEAGSVRYCIVGKEISPKTNRKHLQGFICFSNPRSIAGIKDFFSCPWMHLEVARGSPEQNRKYCSKASADQGVLALVDNPIIEWGQLPAPQGARSDLKARLSPLAAGSQSLSQFIGEAPALYVRYRRGIEALAARAQAAKIPPFRKVEVYVLWGPTGTGKTRFATSFRTPEDTYMLAQASKSGLWFDGYESQSVLVVDEFEPGNISMSTLLRMLDGYKQQFPAKGYFVWGAWDTIFITSNHHPDTWYPLAPKRS